MTMHTSPSLSGLKRTQAKILALQLVVGGLRVLYYPFAQLLLKLQVALNFMIYRAHFRFDFKPREDDIFIVTFGKSGTTWMQMILHQLLTDGDMGFTHISQIMPPFEGWRDDAFEQYPSPRVFKSHLRYEEIPKSPARYIYVYRDPADMLVSLYYHEISYNSFKGTFHDYFKVYRGRHPRFSWANHVAGWKKNTEGLRILYVQFEDMIRDLPSVIRQVIRFCELEIPETEMPRILTRCSFDFMKAHESKFDEATGMMLDAGWKAGNFIRRGKTREGRSHLTSEELEWIESEKKRCEAMAACAHGSPPKPINRVVPEVGP